MKTAPNRGGSGEMERKYENSRQHSSHRQHNRSCYNYYGNHSRGYHSRYSGKMRPSSHIYLDWSRNRNVKNNGFNLASLMSLTPQIPPRCEQEAAPWSEEALERERQQQLSDTANKLKNKLKMWSSEKSDGQVPEVSNNEGSKGVSSPQVNSKQAGQPQKKQTGNVNEKQGKKTEKANNEKERNNQLPSGKMQWKNNSQGISKTTQRKIQQNIIGELMAMPKDNLNNVLVNPKIHPKIEKKMAQIVKENRLILAQKFRHLAESKMNGQGQGQFQSKFVNDVENFIDPDLAIDLCQLPPEFIQQIGDIFQMDFDGCLRNAEPQEDSNSCNVTHEDGIGETMDYNDSYVNNDIVILESSRKNDFKGINVKMENQPSHKDIEIEEPKIGKISVRDFANICNESRVNIKQPSVSSSTTRNSVNRSECPAVKLEKLPITDEGSAKRTKTSQNGEEQCRSNLNSKSVSTLNNDSIQNLTATPEPDSSTTMRQPVIKKETQEHWVPWDQTTESQIFEERTETETRSENNKSIINDVLRNSQPFEKKSCEVQTIISIKDVNQSTEIEKEFEEDTIRSELLEELDSIENLIHDLSRRKFFLFLKLVNLKKCKSTNGLRNQLIRSVTYSDKSVAIAVKKMLTNKVKRPSQGLPKNTDKKINKRRSKKKAETCEDVICLDS